MTFVALKLLQDAKYKTCKALNRQNYSTKYEYVFFIAVINDGFDIVAIMRGQFDRYKTYV